MTVSYHGPDNQILCTGDLGEVIDLAVHKPRTSLAAVAGISRWTRMLFLRTWAVFFGEWLAGSYCEHVLSAKLYHPLMRSRTIRLLMVFAAIGFFVDGLIHPYTWPGEFFQPKRTERLIRVLDNSKFLKGKRFVEEVF